MGFVPNEPLSPSQSSEDSFLDSLLNFQDFPNPSLAEVMNSEQKQEEEKGSEKLGDLIQEEMGRVSLASNDSGFDDVKQEKDNLETVSDENLIKNDSFEAVEDNGGGSESSSSSTASSSSDDEESDEEGFKKEVEMEEGEILEVLDDDDEEDGDVVKGPIRSRNEVQDLPPVPPVTVTIQPHHQTLPVGLVLSIMGCQVVVEGVENHSPLSEGSILWVTESRTPLGVVDEIFGPVKNPYYVVRYNSEAEIPAGIQPGSLVSFVPEFADYVLNSNKDLYKKGYDASNENDEELSEEVEFSDDEKEAEYKRMKKMSKRGSGGEKNGRMKKDKKSRNRSGNWKNDQQPSGNGNSQVIVSSSMPTNGPQAFSASQPPNIAPSGVWPYGFPSIQPQNINFPSNVPPFMQQNMQQNFIQQPFQNFGVPNMATFNPQFNPTPGLQMFPGASFLQGVPPNVGPYASWPSTMPQNQSQSNPQMVFQGVAMPARVEMGNNTGAAGSGQIFNQGNGGRKPFQRGGGGRFRGGRSGPSSR